MRTHGLTDPVIALRRQTDYQFSPNWLSGAEDELSGVSLPEFPFAAPAQSPGPADLDALADPLATYGSRGRHSRFLPPRPSPRTECALLNPSHSIRLQDGVDRLLCWCWYAVLASKRDHLARKPVQLEAIARLKVICH
jgi:hypothetical protein